MRNMIDMNVFIRIWLLIAVLVLPFFGTAQNGNRYSASITVIVKNPAKFKGTVLTFQIQQKGINTGFIGYTKSVSLQIKKKISTITLPLSTPLNYVTIVETKNGVPYLKRVFEKANGLFIVQNGDNIQLHLSTKQKDVFFTGKNSAKYNCQYSLGINTSYSLVNFNYYWGIGDYKRAFEAGKFQYDSVFRVQEKILSSFKNILGKRIFQLIRLDILSYREQSIADQFSIPFLMKKTYSYEIAKKFFTDNFGNKHRYDSIEPSLATQSFVFCDFLSFIEKMSVVIAKATPSDNYYSHLPFSDIDSAINKDYSKGLVKDKLMLLSYLSLDHRRQGDYVNFLKYSILSSTYSLFRNELIDFDRRNTVGTSIFNFALPDTKGILHQLSDFKGKLVVIDFWFDGCGGCKYMAEVLKPIIEHFKPNQNVVFISVSTDRSLNVWKKSVKNELYCSKDEINLIAQNGDQSEIIKYFSVNQYPMLVVLSSDGTLITTSPPDPRENAKKFTAFIEKKINQKNPN